MTTPVGDAVGTHGHPEAAGFYHWPPDPVQGWLAMTPPADNPDAIRPGSVLMSYQHGHPAGAAAFRMEEQFAYYDAIDEEVYVVPADFATFRSDLTSVPQLVSWFVPPVGEHLRAALVHDALVVASPAVRPASLGAEWIRLVSAVSSIGLALWALVGLDSWPLALAGLAVFVAVAAQLPPNTPITEGTTHLGEPLGRPTADRIFRDAMRLDRTKLLRRWLMWSAVTAATRWESPMQSRARKWLAMLLVAVTFGAVITLGVLATADLIDIWEPVNLPWMGNLVWWREIVQGAAGAVAVPVAVSVAWRSQQRAAVLGGIALAFLVHVTLAILAVYGIYVLIEETTDRAHRRWLE